MFIALTEDTREVIHRNGAVRPQVRHLAAVPVRDAAAGHEAHGASTNGRSLLFRRLDDLALYDGMHVVLRPRCMRPAEMQTAVLEEYEKFYSIRRIVLEALNGTFVRFRRLTEAQREFVASLPTPRKRLGMWFRLHVEYKYAPVSFLAVGRKRVHDFLRDAEYADYVTRLTSL